MPAKEFSWLTARPIAHRGYHNGNNKCWENTLSAFEAACDRGFAIECDVHLTLDGQVIVFHDDTLMRMAGADGFVWQRTAQEMQALRIRDGDDHPPTLAQLLELVDGKVPLVIELKGNPGHDEGLVALVCDQLRAYKGKAAIMSFDHWIIRQFPEHAGDIPCGLTALGNDRRFFEAHFSMLGYVDFVSYCLGDMPNPFVSFVREKLDLPVITWTVLDAAAVRATHANGGQQITFEGFDPETIAVA